MFATDDRSQATLRNRLLREAEFIQHALIRPGGLHRIKVITLKVFHQREHHRFLVRHISDKSRNLLHSRQLSSSQTPLSRDQFIDAVALSAD